jgi:dTMP kinase
MVAMDDDGQAVGQPQPGVTGCNRRPDGSSGLFVVFEGGDSVGKTTQVNWLAASLKQAGIEYVLTFEPGDTWLGTQIRRTVLDPSSGQINARAEALLYAADKAQHVGEVISPALLRGKVVVCDRYVDSLIAYQAAGRGLQPDNIARIATWATCGIVPDLTVLLDADPRDAVAKVVQKDRLERAGLDLHERVRASFRAIAAQNPDRYLVLNARGSRSEIAAAIRDRLSGFGLKLSDPESIMAEH